VIETAHAISEKAVLDALRRVFDPELDESIVELGFVGEVRVDGDTVELGLRLPTFWCAPNFSYLMAHDARVAVLQVDGVRQVRIDLKDNAYSDEISVGVSSGRSFVQVFPGQADGDDLDELRLVFARKAFGMRQEQLTRFLLDTGLTPEQVVRLRTADTATLPRGAAPLAQMYLDRRRRLGLDSEVLICDDEGEPIASDELEEHLKRMRKQRVSMTFNSLMCRGLLEARYGRGECL
jgi:metal-sulfur cluster biosynthetic enzyme